MIEYLEEIGIAAAVISAIWGAWLFIKRPLYTIYSKTKYNYGTGYHILKDIEGSFGRDAAEKLLSFMKNADSNSITYNMRLDILEDAANIGIYVCNPDGNCIYANHTLSKMFGKSKDEMLGFGWLDAVVDKRSAYENWSFSVKNRIPHKDKYEIVVNGTTIKVETEAEPKEVEKGIVLGYVGLVRKT